MVQMQKKVLLYILWLASMIVNNNKYTAPNKSIVLFVVFVVPIAADPTIIILLLLSHRIECIPSSTEFTALSVCLCECVYIYVSVEGLLNASTINYSFIHVFFFGFLARHFTLEFLENQISYR